MNLASSLRLVGLSALGLVLASALAAQSAGIALSRKAPDTALSLFPLNGLAQEKLAALSLLAAAQEDEAIASGPQRTEECARAAYRNEPLTPQALAILAMAEQDQQTRSRIVVLASELDRREPRLQAVVLQEQVAAQDYAGAVATLDRILRVGPSRAQEVFPTLLAVFARDGAVEEFAQILDGSSRWHHAFFEYAVRQPSALPNLLSLRRRVSFDDERLDQALLRNLVAQGDIGSAYEFYLAVGGGELQALHGSSLGWTTTYAPFDWELSDEAGLRAQPSLNSEHLEISVKPGRGGVIARRLLEAPQGPFVLQVKHGEAATPALRDIDVGLRCVAEGQVILDASLAKQDGGFEIGSLPASCTFLEVTIAARAWSGRAALNEQIDSIRIVG
ncbi:hypothetical protein [Tritonibacter scottomollicae]|uniref:hypothetical protein n=1 Tax=Tritonibacter scottomollicae TaxID=483013 RepID=UPI003AA8C3D4